MPISPDQTGNPAPDEGTTITLQQLADAATSQGIPAEIANTGGGVMALAVKVDGGEYLMALDDGYREGTTWCIATDGDTRETVGELETDSFPINSDAEQIMRDAVGWVRADHGRTAHPDA